MRKILVMAALPFFIAGCATKTVDSTLSGYQGVNTRTDSAGNAYLDSVEFTRAGHQADKDALPLCVTRAVRNSSVTLTGSSSTYVSPWSGVTYNNADSSESSGGQVIEYVSDDGREIVASGTSGYQISVMAMPIQKYLRYTLNAKVTESETRYLFENLTQAQGNTGTAQNVGFSPVGAWSAAKPGMAYQALSDVADEVESCMSAR